MKVVELYNLNHCFKYQSFIYYYVNLITKVKQVNFILKYIGKDVLLVFTCSLHHINLTWIAERMVKMMLLNYML